MAEHVKLAAFAHQKAAIRSPGTLLTLALSAVLTAPADCQADPIGYNYTLIADTRGGFGVFGPSVPINSSGTAAFLGTLATGGAGIFTGSGGPVTTIADTSGPLTFGFSGIAIDDSGTVAFPSGFSGGVGVFTGSGGSITTIADNSGGIVGVGEPVSINNAGTVAFLAALAQESTLGLLIGNGGPVIGLYDTRVSGPFFTFGSPAINDSGTVAFFAGIRGTVDFGAILTGTGGATTTIVSGAESPLTRLSSRPDLNESGVVAFDADFKAGGQGIFIGSGGPIITIADTSGPFAGFPGQNPIINNNGTVVFFAMLDTGEVGLFTGPHPVADRVIATGDPLLGSIVVDLPTNGARPGLNDAGQVAFTASLADGRRVVVRADPVGVIPEPSSLTLLTSGTFLLFVTRLALASRGLNARRSQPRLR